MQAFHLLGPAPFYTNSFLLISDAGHRVAGGDGITGLRQWGELPVLIGNGIQIHTALQEKAAFFRQLGHDVQRIGIFDAQQDDEAGAP
mgnify:CR=1 FL=1